MMRNYIFLSLLFISSISISQVGIGNTSPDPSAILDITSKTAGMLVPRMNQAQRVAISAPATGLLIYQNDAVPGFWFFDGTSWNSLSGGGGSGGEFQSIGGVVQNTTDIYSDDFVFGSSYLGGNDAQFFFDKSKAAFRAGRPINNNYDDVNVGEYSSAFGFYSMAKAENSFATTAGSAEGANSVAFIGGHTGLSASNSMAIGQSSNVAGTDAVAIGNTANASENYTTAIGQATSASKKNATAIGHEATASGIDALALGKNTNATGNNSVSFTDANANGESSFAANGGTADGFASMAFIAGTTTPIASYSIAMGLSSNVAGTNAVAIGNTANASANFTTAIGQSTTSSALNATSIGHSASASGVDALALGKNTNATGNNSVSFSDSDAIGDYSFAANGGKANGIASMAFIVGTTTTNADYSMAMGQNSSVADIDAFAIGNTANASAKFSTAIGHSATASGQNTTAIGYNTTASGQNAIALGINASAVGSQSVSLSNSFANADNTFAVNGGKANGIGSIAMISASTDVTAINSIAIGAYASTKAKNSVSIGLGTVANSYAETVLGYYNSTYTPASTTTFDSSDRLLVVGNGSSSTRNNVLTIMKDGRTGIGRIPATNSFEVEGEASKSTPGNWTGNSDRRLKKEIETYSEEEALQSLLKLRGVTYL